MRPSFPPKSITRFWIITALMTVSFLVGSWLVPRFRVVWDAGPLPDQAYAQSNRPLGLGNGSTTLSVGPEEPVARAVAGASPSVVNIDTVKRVVENDSFFGPQEYQESGAGSGVVIDPRGYVLTNDHVVGGATEITVTFGNGRKYQARVLGTDRETDVGLVQLLNPPKDLPVAKLGDSRRLVPGQWAIAIGNPLGFQQTVTLGVVSHTGRAMQVDDRVYKRLIQTDAAINPGNSGGALINIHGEVIGINTVVRNGAQNLGFAIPIDVAKGLSDELIRSGKIKRPWTGLNVTEVTPDLAAYLGLERREGAIVERLDRRGPAYRGGIRPGDLILELSGKKVKNRAEVEALLSRAKIGDTLNLMVERGGELLKGDITVAEKP